MSHLAVRMKSGGEREGRGRGEGGEREGRGREGDGQEREIRGGN